MEEKGELLGAVILRVPGKFNAMNALATLAAARVLDISFPVIASSLASFVGIWRRFEIKGKYKNALVVSDYAHHPTEIKATLTSAKDMDKKRVWVVFQPHTYSRTKALLDGFAKVLKLADHILIADVYPAREEYDGTIHSCDLAAKIKGAVYMSDMKAIARYLKPRVGKGDLLITLGAGDVKTIGYDLAAGEQDNAGFEAVL